MAPTLNDPPLPSNVAYTIIWSQGIPTLTAIKGFRGGDNGEDENTWGWGDRFVPNFSHLGRIWDANNPSVPLDQLPLIAAFNGVNMEHLLINVAHIGAFDEPDIQDVVFDRVFGIYE